MILTCPDCATSYFVDDDRIPPTGRTVKCSSCGVRWRTEPAGEPSVEADPAAAPEASEPSPVPQLAEIAPSRAKPKSGRRRGRLYAGLGAVILLILTLTGAAVFRQPVVNLLPEAAPVFSALGLKVDATGLAIEAVSFEPRLETGQPTLLVKGVIRNRRNEARRAPPIRIRLLDAKGTVVGGVTARPVNGAVPAAALRYFAITVASPPVEMAGIKIDFDLDAKSDPVAEDAARAAPAPLEAQPLAEGAPDALPSHAEH